MSRNKYPEKTIEKIMEAGADLFIEKGYLHTTVEDIVTKANLTKGAFYHHFKSKEELLQKVSHTYFANMDWCYQIQSDPTLNGLEKLKSLFFHELGNDQKRKMDRLIKHFMQDPNILKEQLHSSIYEIAPPIKALIEEGLQDGSLRTPYPRQLSEVLVILINFWINPGIFESTKESFMEKIYFMKDMLDKLELPIFDKALIKNCSEYYDVIANT